jgi:hypothetical protein
VVAGVRSVATTPDAGAEVSAPEVSSRLALDDELAPTGLSLPTEPATLERASPSTLAIVTTLSTDSMVDASSAASTSASPAACDEDAVLEDDEDAVLEDDEDAVNEDDDADDVDDDRPEADVTGARAGVRTATSTTSATWPAGSSDRETTLSTIDGDESEADSLATSSTLS